MPVTCHVTRRRGCVLPGTPVSPPGTDLNCADTGLDLGCFPYQGNVLHSDRSQLLHPDLDSPFDLSEQPLGRDQGGRHMASSLPQREEPPQPCCPSPLSMLRSRKPPQLLLGENLRLLLVGGEGELVPQSILLPAPSHIAPAAHQPLHTLPPCFPSRFLPILPSLTSWVGTAKPEHNPLTVC